MTSPRLATAPDLEAVVEILVGAFDDDPAWSWAFPDPEARPGQYARLWRFFVEGALRYPTVWLTGDGSATSVWIPPGGTELSHDQEEQLPPLLVDLAGDRAPLLTAMFDAFDRAHPRGRPHHYLSLLGTRPDRRGHGHGLALLTANLEQVDATGLPAYLEASNSANVALYARQGFEVLGRVALPDGGPEVVTMWREGHRAR